MKTRSLLLAICLMLYCFAAMIGGQAQQAVVQRKQYAPVSWKWMQDKWTGDEQPYQKARTELDKALNATNREPLLKRYREQFERSPKDPLALFRWAYSAYWTVPRPRHSELSDVLRTFDRMVSPHVYNYTRIRFLVQSKESANAKLKDAGLRLDAHTPKDSANRLCLANILSYSDSLDDLKLATKYSDALCRESPGKPVIVSVAGSTYLYLWNKTKKPEDANKAIGYFQKYLTIASPHDYYVEEAKRFIKLMQDELAKSGKTP